MARKHSLIALGVFLLFGLAGLWLLPAWREYRETRQALDEADRRLLQHQSEIHRLKTEIHRLKTDPRAIERVARDKFGWCRPGETVYDFSDSDRR